MDLIFHPVRGQLEAGKPNDDGQETWRCGQAHFRAFDHGDYLTEQWNLWTLYRSDDRLGRQEMRALAKVNMIAYKLWRPDWQDV